MAAKVACCCTREGLQPPGGSAQPGAAAPWRIRAAWGCCPLAHPLGGDGRWVMGERHPWNTHLGCHKREAFLVTEEQRRGGAAGGVSPLHVAGRRPLAAGTVRCWGRAGITRARRGPGCPGVTPRSLRSPRGPAGGAGEWGSAPRACAPRRPGTRGYTAPAAPGE